MALNHWHLMAWPVAMSSRCARCRREVRNSHMAVFEHGEYREALICKGKRMIHWIWGYPMSGHTHILPSASVFDWQVTVATHTCELTDYAYANSSDDPLKLGQQFRSIG